MATPSETGATARVRAPAVYEVGRDQPASIALFLGMDAVVTTGGAFSLRTPAGQEIITDRAITPGTVSTASIEDADLPSTMARGEGYVAEWALEWTGGSGRFKQPVILARTAVHCPVTQLDVEGKHPGVSKLLRGTDAAAMQGFGDDAFSTVVRRLLNEGRLIESVVDIDSLVDPILNLWLANAFRHFYVATGDERYDRTARDYREAYGTSWATVRTKMDTDLNGVQDSTTRQSPTQVLRREFGPGYVRPVCGSTRGAM